MTSPDNPAPPISFAGKKSKKSRERIILLVLFLIAAAMRAALYFRMAPGVSDDATRYVLIAEAFLKRDWTNAIHFHYGPLFPLLIIPFLGLVSRPEAASQWSAMILNSLTLFPFFFLAKEITNVRVAYAAAILFCFKGFIDAVLGDAGMPHNFFIYLGLYLAVRAYYAKDRLRFFVAGAMFGTGFLCKPEAFSFFVFLLALLIFYFYMDRERLHRAGQYAGLYIAGYFIVALPYLIAYTAVTGQVSLNPKARTLLFLHNAKNYHGYHDTILEDEHGPFTRAQRIYMEGDRIPIEGSLIKFLWQDAGRISRDYQGRLYFTLRNTVPGYLWVVFPYLGPVFFVVGFIRRGWTRERLKREAFLYWLGICPVLLVPMFNPETRFFNSLWPVVIIGVARGLYQSLVWVHDLFFNRKTDFDGRVWGAAFLIIAGLMCIPDIYKTATVKRNNSYWVEMETRDEVAEWLKPHLAGDCRIMSALGNMPLGFLAGLPAPRQIVLPNDDIRNIVRYAEARQVKYIIVTDEDLLPHRSPLLAPVMEDGFSYSRIKKVFEIESPLHNRYLVFDVLAVNCGKGVRPRNSK